VDKDDPLAQLQFINELLLVPVFYAICVLDVKIVKWDRLGSEEKVREVEFRVNVAGAE
jgi:hypothetical protein